jgi:isoquinoline 1-oxidoreductase subunit beta
VGKFAPSEQPSRCSSSQISPLPRTYAPFWGNSPETVATMILAAKYAPLAGVAITFKNGRVEQGNFNDFRLVSIEESPTDTRVHIVEHGIDVPASGVGEPGVPPFAPALCNAIFAATGKRVRSLPIGDRIAL